MSLSVAAGHSHSVWVWVCTIESLPKFSNESEPRLHSVHSSLSPLSLYRPFFIQWHLRVLLHHHHTLYLIICVAHLAGTSLKVPSGAGWGALCRAVWQNLLPSLLDPSLASVFQLTSLSKCITHTDLVFSHLRCRSQFRAERFHLVCQFSPSCCGVLVLEMGHTPFSTGIFLLCIYYIITYCKLLLICAVCNLGKCILIRKMLKQT